MTVRVYSVAGVAAADAPPQVRVFSVATVAEPVAPPRVRIYSLSPVAAAESSPPAGSPYLWIDSDGSVRVARWAQVFGGQLFFLDGAP